MYRHISESIFECACYEKLPFLFFMRSVVVTSILDWNTARARHIVRQQQYVRDITRVVWTIYG